MSDSPTLSSSRSRLARVPAEFEDATVWAAWLYYVDSLTQSDIADVLGVSRATVIKMLQDARDRGVVSIRINPDTVQRAQLARDFAARYGLASVSVVPSLEGAPIEHRLGEAAALVLADALEPGDIVGVAWGRTVMAMARAISPPPGIGPLTVVQVSGSSTGRSADFSPELCSTLLANRLGARCVNLLAPAILSSASLRDQLLAEPALMRQREVIHSANRIVFGVGDLLPTATIRSVEMMDEPTIDALVARGAEAVIIGQMIDTGGQPMSDPIFDRMVGITLEELKRVPYRLCVAGGLAKREAIAATMRGGYATHLVIDSATAEALMA
jgi:DNA-binding transcriptional regulator LsrR (DeoR family)